MNSEELELSLRTEFEEHLKNVLAEMRQELSHLQEKVEGEFEKHKSQLMDVFQNFSARIATERELDAGFTDSVVEHLRLARDEGARITATAIAEAEEMQAATAESKEPGVGISDVRDAINDISNQTSQSSILKSLVQHAAKFTTRGAFFILKNEHFVGWRVFGSNQDETDDQIIREIFFPISTETVLGEAVRSLSAVESSYGTYAGDSAYLNKLEFGQPDRMYAIPLIARGRGVAVLYADTGQENEAVNIEALETLVRVAGLTVEVTASPGGNARYETPTARAGSVDSSSSGASTYVADRETTNNFEAKNDFQADESGKDESDKNDSSESYQPENQFTGSQTAADFSSSFNQNSAETLGKTDYQSTGDNFSYQSDFQTENSQPDFVTNDFQVEVVENAEADTQDFQSLRTEENDLQSTYKPAESLEETYSWNADSDEFSADRKENTESFQPAFESAPTEDFSFSKTSDYQAEDNQYENRQSQDLPQFQVEENVVFDNSQFENSWVEPTDTPRVESAEKFTPQPENFLFGKEDVYDSFNAPNEKANNFVAEPVEPVSQSATPPVRSRFSDRNVDLPIEVSEDERRLHNDARRFARLLVSEIKLYNEQKVREGRESSDLYDRLREAIDRSREMYDKRVQPPVAAKFDYFHYELVNNLAEGEQAKLGGSYSKTSS